MTDSTSYTPEQFTSISMLTKIHDGGFAELGFYFMLRDILKCKNGVIDLKALASSLGITMMRVYNFIGILEDAFIIRTTATPNGRYIDFLGMTDSEASTAKFSQDCMNYLMDYLKSHGIEAGKAKDYSDLNPEVITTAVYMGDHFQVIRDFYSTVKSTLNQCQEFQYSLAEANIPVDDNGRVVAFARGLHKIGYLSSYEYKKAPHRIITAQVDNSPEAHNFISGSWLEHYVYYKAKDILTGEYACVRNLNVTLPENEQFEFDMLICTGQNIVWVECKTGKYSPYLTKYSRIAQLLGLEAKNTILVTAETQAVDVSAAYGITCCNLEDFPEAFRKACT